MVLIPASSLQLIWTPTDWTSCRRGCIIIWCPLFFLRASQFRTQFNPSSVKVISWYSSTGCSCLYTQVHFQFWQLGRVGGQYTTLPYQGLWSLDCSIIYPWRETDRQTDGQNVRADGYSFPNCISANWNTKFRRWFELGHRFYFLMRINVWLSTHPLIIQVFRKVNLNKDTFGKPGDFHMVSYDI